MKKSGILIVEDERIVALSIQDTLSADGISVCGIVSSGEQALEQVQAGRVDLCLMDIKIKGRLDGIETADNLQKNYQVPVVFLTAFSNQEIIERAKKVHPLGFVMKPFKARELIAVVELALYKAKMEKKVQLLNADLENKVKQRTLKLSQEINLRRNAEARLKKQTQNLQKANRALKAALENRDAEKRAIEEVYSMDFKKYILPHIEGIEQMNRDEKMASALYQLKLTAREWLDPDRKGKFGKYIDLTPRQAKIAELIRSGKSTKEIARLMNISPSSVSTYRNHIRKKLGLLNSGQNLVTYLTSSEKKM